MNSPHTSPGRPDSGPSVPVTSPELARALRLATIGLGALVLTALVLGGAVGWLVAGSRGLWAAVLGAGVALVFSGPTVWSVRQSQSMTATGTMGLVMGTWIAKIVVIVVILAVLQDRTFFDHTVFGVVLLLTVLAGAVLDLVVVQRARVPYVTPQKRDDPPADSASGRTDS